MSSAPFSTAALPQISAGNTFHATLAIGVFAAMMRPATPHGWRTVIVLVGRSAGRRAAVQPLPFAGEEAPSAIAPPASPNASFSDLPVSRATISASSC